jgi:signal transduction histidine kinase
VTASRCYSITQMIFARNRFAELGLTASLLKDNVDVVRGIIVTFQDITRMVQMEEEMRRQERLATIGSLAAGIAHEIRNPLASLSGSIQILKEDLHLEGESRQLMDIVLRETDRLNTIITEFLDYAKPKTIQNDIVCLSELAQETAGLFQNSLGSRHEIHLMAEIEPSLSVRGDGQRLRQVFWNLLINSGQAITGAGTISMKVHGTTSSGVDQVLIRIADTGIGIPTKLLGKIFDPFFTTKTDGTGLGLAIVHRIVEDHGGSIDVKSEEGSGTAFTIFLPVQERARSVSMRV